MRALLCLLCCFCAAQALAQNTGWQVPDAVRAASLGLEAPTVMTRRGLQPGLPHVSTALAELLEKYTGGLAEEPLALRIRVQHGASPAVQAALLRLGGNFEAELGRVLYASLPASQVAALARSKGLLVIEPQAQFAAQALEIPATRTAVLAALQQTGQRGRGVRVGVLDFGFAGYVAAGLPAPLAQRAFAPGTTLETGSAHGTECARLIQQIAPDASLLLASVGDGRNAGEGQVLAAAQWLVAQGAQVINISASGYVSALDGTAMLDQFIDQQTRQGRTWVVAAGNQAQLHWRGKIADSNHNGWVDLGLAGQGDLLAFEVTQAGPVSLTLNWSPWNGAAADLDAFLYAVGLDGRSRLLEQSDGLQASEGNRPVESLTRVLSPGYYLLGMRATRLASSGEVHVFITGAARMSPVDSSGSVGSPGTAARALTVGAAARTGRVSANYSGRGPTVDGRRKPELLAAGQSTGFAGSSAAAPVVTGLAALLLGAQPGMKQDVLRHRLRELAVPSEDASAVWGVIDLEAVPSLAGAAKLSSH